MRGEQSDARSGEDCWRRGIVSESANGPTYPLNGDIHGQKRSSHYDVLACHIKMSSAFHELTSLRSLVLAARRPALHRSACRWHSRPSAGLVNRTAGARTRRALLSQSGSADPAS